jgi:hypothetical protein
VQDVPPTAQARLRGDPGIRLVKIPFYWLNIAFPNWSAPPTDKLAFRQAVQAALDFDEIMDAASDGAFSPVKALQIPGSLDDCEGIGLCGGIAECSSPAGPGKDEGRQARSPPSAVSRWRGAGTVRVDRGFLSHSVLVLPVGRARRSIPDVARNGCRRRRPQNRRFERDVSQPPGLRMTAMGESLYQPVCGSNRHADPRAKRPAAGCGR